MDLSDLVSRSNFQFRQARFWSSPDRVPGITIIAHVLCSPAREDVYQVVAFFGVDAVRDVMAELEARGEISERARVRSEEYIQMYLDSSSDSPVTRT